MNLFISSSLTFRFERFLHDFWMSMSNDVDVELHLDDFLKVLLVVGLNLKIFFYKTFHV